jgi:cyclic pyranopterin phosphate synthase
VLRLSLTARCNLACPYCLPDGTEPPGLLSQAQRLAVVVAAVALGARRLRLTGGEPLLHPGLEALIAAAAPLRAPSSLKDSPAPGLREISLTSNGALLTAARARALRAAGLDRLTLSLDGASGESVAAMAGLAGGAAAGEALLAKVLAAIDHARSAGFDPASGQLKLNAVIQRGRNDDQLLPLAALARERGVELRLIEFMDVGNRNGWRPEAVVSAAAMVERIGSAWPLEPLGRDRHGTASRWRYRDGGGARADGAGGHLAVIASVSEPFCGDCDRLRVVSGERHNFRVCRAVSQSELARVGCTGLQRGLGGERTVVCYRMTRNARQTHRQSRDSRRAIGQSHECGSTDRRIHGNRVA